jgi:hypothetical protein
VRVAFSMVRTLLETDSALRAEKASGGSADVKCLGAYVVRQVAVLVRGLVGAWGGGVLLCGWGGSGVA